MVKITESQAIEIETLRDHNYSNHQIVTEWIENGKWSDEPKIFDKMLKAVVSGYQIKGEPEEEIKVYYFEALNLIQEIEENRDELDDELDEDDVLIAGYKGRIEAIKFIIDELNLDIRGIS
jgi:hypothetical protein